jgi:glycosyltransferase involved in cell wall biosynthesis
VPAAPLRILHLYPKADYFTGAAVQMLDLATGLAARGHHVVLATRPSPEWTRQARERDLPYRALAMASGIDAASIRGLVGLLRAHRIQVVHAHKGTARTLALIAALFTPLPVLVANRGVSFRMGRLQAAGYATRRVTAVVAVCESIKRSLIAAGVRPEKIEVIYSGTDTERFHPGVDPSRVRKELGLAGDDLLVTQVGVRSTKGNDDVIDAMSVVARHVPGARLLIVGARDPRPLLERARARGIEHAIRILGYRGDMHEILRASTCCVDASHVGLGLTGALREALAVATPVVATDLEGNRELVRHGVTGLLVPPRDVAALARAVLRIAAHPDHAAAMGHAGRQLVAAEFSMQVKLERMEALYRRLLDERGQPAGRSSAGQGSMA